MASTALLAVSVGSWDANTLPGSGIALQGFPYISLWWHHYAPMDSFMQLSVILPLFHMLTFWEGAV